jgi:hypothetical protein
MMVRKYGGVACMAEEYHGDGDVNGPLCKIGNSNVINVNEQKACYVGREMEDLEGEGKDDVMVMWDSPFVLVTFKTFGMYNIFLTISLNFKIYHVFHLASLCFRMGWFNECS